MIAWQSSLPRPSFACSMIFLSRVALVVLIRSGQYTRSTPLIHSTFAAINFIDELDAISTKRFD